MSGAHDLQSGLDTAALQAARGLSIRPEVFLYPPWRGSGVLCDAFGIPCDRYELHGGGRTEPDGAVVISHHVRRDSGLDSHFEWRFAPACGDEILADDLVTGTEARGRMGRDGFRWTFHANNHTPFGVRRTRVEAVYRLISPHEATSALTLSLFGVTVGTASACLRHAAAEARADWTTAA
jgi:hypothetical protein